MKIPPVQRELPHQSYLNVEEKNLISQEIGELLKKGAISLVKPITNQFISNLFLVDKKDGSHRPVINLKNLNKSIPYQHFKMEGLHSLKDLLRPGDYM